MDKPSHRTTNSSGGLSTIAPRGLSTRSPGGLSTEARALGIDEWCADHFGVDDRPRVMDSDLLAQPPGSPRQHAEGDRTVELRAPDARGHMALGLRRRRGC